MSIVGIATILAVQNVIEAVSRAAAIKPWGVRDLPPISQEDTALSRNFCINARRARATAFPYRREGGLSEPRARLVKRNLTLFRPPPREWVNILVGVTGKG